MLKKIKNKLIYKREGIHKVALIGASGWGSNYLKKLSLSSDFEVGYVVDINTNVLTTIEKRYKYKVSTDIEDIMKADIDTVFIITPNHLHYTFAKQLLESGKNVYIEKPLANTSTEAKELQNIANENKCVLYTCHNLSYEWYMKSIQEILVSKQLGKIYEIECERSLSTAFHMNDNDWRNDKEKCPNGPLMQLGIHFIDFFNDIFGDFDIEYSRLENFNTSNDDYYIGIINYKDVTIKLKFSYLSNNTFNIKINAEKFNLQFDGTELKKIYHNGKIEKLKVNKTDSLENSINEFYSYIENKNIDSNTSKAINAIKSIERLGSYARDI